MVNLRDGATARYDAMRQAMDGGWKRVDAFDFYASMFPEGTLDTAEAWASRSGQDGRVHGRAIMLRLNAGVAETSVQVRTDPTVRRVFVCDGLDALFFSLDKPSCLTVHGLCLVGTAFHVLSLV